MKKKKKTPDGKDFDKSAAIYALGKTVRLAKEGDERALKSLWQILHELARTLASFGVRDAASINVNLLMEIMGRGLKMLTDRIAENDLIALMAMRSLRAMIAVGRTSRFSTGKS